MGDVLRDPRDLRVKVCAGVFCRYDGRPCCQVLMFRSTTAVAAAACLFASLRIFSASAASSFPRHLSVIDEKPLPVEIPVQVNGKLRDLIKIPADASNTDVEKLALASEKVKAAIDGKTIKKVIVVPKKIVNIAVG